MIGELGAFGFWFLYDGEGREWAWWSLRRIRLVREGGHCRATLIWRQP